MPDRVLFPLLGAIALFMIAFALVWPQGLGARSIGPLGHTPVQQVQAAQARNQPKSPPPVLSLAPVAIPSSAAPGPAR